MSIDDSVNECYDLENYKTYQIERIRHDIPSDYYPMETVLSYIQKYHLQIRKDYCYGICEYSSICKLKEYLTKDGS